MEKDLLILVSKPSLEHMAVMDNVNKPDLLSDDELMHYGVEGMKWGVRRYQNPDGTLTSAGKAHLALLRKTDNAKADKFEVDVLKNTEEMKRNEERKEKRRIRKEKRKQKIKEYHESDKYKRKMEKKERLKRERAKKRKQKLEDFMKDELRNKYLKKKYVKQGPRAVAKHIDLYNRQELDDIYNRFQKENDLKRLARDRMKGGKQTIDNLLGYGQSLNKAIDFLNSKGGKEIRKYLGDPNYSNNIANFKGDNNNNNNNNGKKRKKHNN